jgi:hypothetical protein
MKHLFIFDAFVIPITDNLRIMHYFKTWESSERRMDANDFREKAATCLKLAQGLSWKNPSRFRLMDMAENFQRRATELEVQAEQQRQQSRPRE